MNEDLLNKLKNNILKKYKMNINLDQDNLNNVVTVSGLAPKQVRNKFMLIVELKINSWDKFKHTMFTHIAFKPLRIMLDSRFNHNNKIDTELLFSQCLNHYLNNFGLDNVRKDDNGIQILNVEIQNKY